MEVACFKWLGRLFQTNGPEYKILLLRSSVRGLGSDRQLEVAARLIMMLVTYHQERVPKIRWESSMIKFKHWLQSWPQSTDIVL